MGLIIELGVDQEVIDIEMATEGVTVHKVTEETIIDKTVVIKGIGIEAHSQDHSRSRQRYRSNSRDNFRNRSYDRSQSRNRDRSSSREEGQRSRTEYRDRNKENRSTTRSRSSSHVNTNRDRPRCFRCSEYDHFARECPNALTDEESGSGSEDLDDSTWQMLSQVDTSPFQDFDTKDLNM